MFRSILSSAAHVFVRFNFVTQTIGTFCVLLFFSVSAPGFLILESPVSITNTGDDEEESLLAPTPERLGRREALKRRVEIASAPLVFAPDMGMPQTEIYALPKRRWLKAHATTPALAELESQPWVAEAQTALQNFEHELSSGLAGTTHSKSKTKELLASLLRKAPPNPWLRFAHEASRFLSGDRSVARLQATVDALPAEKAFAARRFAANALMLRAAERTNLGKEKLKTFQSKYLSALRDAVDAGLFQDDDAGHTLVAFYMYSTAKNANRPQMVFPKEFEALMAASSGKVVEWARQLILGNFHHRRAWKERGTGFSDTVSADGWLGFDKHSTMARDCYKRSWKLYPKHPLTATGMICISYEGHGVADDTARLWFDRAVKASPNFALAYNSYLWSLRPRWGGSVEEMTAFARACINAGKIKGSNSLKIFADKIGPYYDDIGEDLRDHLNKTGLGREFIAAFIAAAQDPAREKTKRYHLGNATLYAWLLRDYQTAQKALDALGWKLDASHFYEFPLNPPNTGTYYTARGWWNFLRVHQPRILGEAAVYSDKGASAFANGMSAWEKRNFDTASKFFDEAVHLSSSERAKSWARAMHASSQAGEQLQKTGSVNLAKPEFQDLWTVPAGMGLEKNSSSGTLRIKADKVNKKSTAVTLAFTPVMLKAPTEDFEVIAKIRRLSPPSVKGYCGVTLFLAECFQKKASVLADAGSDPHESEHGALLSLEKNKAQMWAIFSEGDNARKFNRKPISIPNKPSHDFRVERRDGLFHFFVDDVPANKGIRLVESFGGIFLGATWAAEDKSVEFALDEYTVRLRR